MVKLIIISGFITLFLVSVQADEYSDPTRPYRTVKSKASTLTKPLTEEKANVLQAIIIENDRRKAVINETSIQVGESINGYRVHKILDEKVVLQRGELYQTLYLSPKIKLITERSKNNKG